MDDKVVKEMRDLLKDIDQKVSHLLEQQRFEENFRRKNDEMDR